MPARYQYIKILSIIILSLTCLSAASQYYYKDLVTTLQTNKTFQLYKANKINQVTLNSFQGNTPVTEGFVGGQKVSLAQNKVVTYTKTSDRGENFFTAYYNTKGQLVKTIDSLEESTAVSLYQYDALNRLIQISQETHAVDNSSSTTEKHYWTYKADGKPETMLRIKNKIDSTLIKISLDKKGNVAEEEALRKGRSTGKIFYYYDEMDRLTDVVRYNVKAGRLLPDYMFEYEENGELSTLTLIPEGSSDYQKWYYKYDDTGLKLAEFCYNKRNELLGKIEYDYTAGR